MLTLRNVPQDDAALRKRTLAFLRDNPDGGVRSRPDEMLERAFESGMVLIVESEGELVASSFLFKYALGEPVRVYAEIGTMRVVLNGRGIQKFLTWTHLMHAQIEEAAPEGAGCFAVVAEGSVSHHNLTSAQVGMRPWIPPPELRMGRSEAGLPFLIEKLTLFADPTAVGSAFSALRTAHRGGRMFALPKGEDVIEIALGGFDETWLQAF